MGLFKALFGSMNQKRTGGRSNVMCFELDRREYEYKQITNAILDGARVIRWISGAPDKRNYRRLERYKSKISNWKILILLDRTFF